MTQHHTSANIHLHGEIHPFGRMSGHPDDPDSIYGSVDLDRGSYASNIYVENSAQAAALAEAFTILAAKMADAEQIIAEAAAAQALEKTEREQREAAELADADIDTPEGV